MAYSGGSDLPPNYSDAVTRQPGYGSGEELPLTSIQGVPIGLEVLAPLDSITVKHKNPELKSKWNKYEVFNKQGGLLFNVEEEPGDEHARMYMAPNRGFNIEIKDTSQQRAVVYMQRDTKMCVACCCADGTGYWPIQVYDRNTEKIGMLRMRKSCCSFIFGVHDKSDKWLYTINGKLCRCGDDIDFPVSDRGTGNKIGNIGKHNPGDETSTYIVDFPMQMDCVSKMLIFCSVFMIEYILYGNELGGERYVEKGGGMTRYLPD